MKSLLRTFYRVIKWFLSTVKSVLKRRPIRIDRFVVGTIEKDDIKLIKNILKHPETWVEGKAIKEFEDSFAKYIGADKSFSFLGGRIALSAILEAFDIKPGDEVILPAYTCVVVPNAIRYKGATPVFVDIELDTLGPDVDEVRKAITPRTKVIIIHHLFGMVCRDYEKLLSLAKEKGVKLVEDCAHATGAAYLGKKVGTYGDAAFFSTEQSKVISTRMGGIAISRHKEINEKLELIQKQAAFPQKAEIFRLFKETYWLYKQYKAPNSWWLNPWLQEIALKYSTSSTTEQETQGEKPSDYGKRMPNAMALLGLNQLAKIEKMNQRRRKEAENWKNWVITNNYNPLKVIDGSIPVFLRYPVLVEPDRKKNTLWSRQLGVEIGVWFVSMEHPCKVECKFKNASTAIEGCISFPTLRR